MLITQQSQQKKILVMVAKLKVTRPKDSNYNSPPPYYFCSVHNFSLLFHTGTLEKYLFPDFSEVISDLACCSHLYHLQPFFASAWIHDNSRSQTNEKDSMTVCDLFIKSWFSNKIKKKKNASVKFI